jgi:hypothetical protein
MPITTTVDEPNLCGIVAMPIRTTDQVWRPADVSPIQASSTAASVNNTHSDMRLTRF